MEKKKSEKISFISQNEIPQLLLQDRSTALAFEDIYSQVGNMTRPKVLIADIHSAMASIGFLPMGRPYESIGLYENVRLEFRSNVGDLKINEYKYCRIYIHMLPLCTQHFMKHVTKIICVLTMYNRKQTKKIMKKEIITRYKDILEESKDIS
jgi:hypothetical protein